MAIPMDHSDDHPVTESLLASAFLKELELLYLHAKKRRSVRSKYKVKQWQGKGALEFSEFRQYSPGDDLRKVDWNVYRRLQEVMVREYETEMPSHLVVALDASSSMNFYHKWWFARRLAAALSYLGLALLDKVTFVVYPEVPAVRQTFSGKPMSRSLLYQLDQVKIQPPGAIDWQKLEKSLLSLPRRASVILISDFYDPLYHKVLPLVRLHSIRSLAIQIIAPEEKKPPLKGFFHMKDAEAGKEVPLIVDQKRLALYQKQWREHLQRLQSLCRKKSIFHFSIEPHQPLELSLQALQKAGMIH